MEFSSRRSTNLFIYCLVCFVVTWVAIEILPGLTQFNSRTFPQCGAGPEAQVEDVHHLARSKAQMEDRMVSDKCKTRDGHYEDDEENVSHDAWSQMKWIGKPAACRVRGELIEKLDAANNFRRGFALQFTREVEDRSHIMPWLLGSRIDLNLKKRRVYLDLGSKTFGSSIEWFIRMYPCDFTEIHAFEIVKERLRIPQPFDEETNWIDPNRFSRRTKGMAGIPSWMLDRVQVYNKLVSDFDDAEAQAINITRFIKDELQLTANDTVVVKMDIEESEWPILTRWLNDPDMAAIIDEIFVEVHYKHPSMLNYHWGKFKHERNEAKRLLADLRWKGFFVHFWP